MTVYERIKQLSDSRKMTVAEVEKVLGMGVNSMYAWKNKIPNGTSLEKAADYFHVTVDYLLGREELPEKPPVDLTEVAESENWDNWLSAGGKPLTDNDKKLLKAMFGDD